MGSCEALRQRGAAGPAAISGPGAVHVSLSALFTIGRAPRGARWGLSFFTCTTWLAAAAAETTAPRMPRSEPRMGLANRGAVCA